MNSARNPSLLIVDDSETNIDMLVDTLGYKYEVIVAMEGESALEIVTETLPDLILLDIMMPGIDGYEVCRRLKQREETREIPVIFVTAKDDVENERKGFKVGGVDYITKPFNPAIVKARVKTHLELKQARKELEHKNEILMGNAQLREETVQRLKEREQELSRANRKLERLASLDGLTQLANRRMFNEHLAREFKLQCRNQSALSVILCDIDYFKHYNDRYGHQAGDECLKKVAGLLKDSVRRPTDLAARYGGEEFVLILPDTDGKGAIQVAQRIKRDIRKLKISHALSDISRYLTLSTGVSTAFPGHANSADILVKTADKALYEAKGKGRNNYRFKECKL